MIIIAYSTKGMSWRFNNLEPVLAEIDDIASIEVLDRNWFVLETEIGGQRVVWVRIPNRGRILGSNIDLASESINQITASADMVKMTMRKKDTVKFSFLSHYIPYSRNYLSGT